MSLVNKENLKKYIESADIFTNHQLFEDFDECKITISIDSLEDLLLKINNIKHIEFFTKIFTFIDSNDKFTVNILDDVECVISFHSLAEIEAFSYAYDLIDKNVTLELYIQKVDKDYLTIYSVENFVFFLNESNNIVHIFELFANHKKIFKVLSDDDFNIKTNSFCFFSVNKFPKEEIVLNNNNEEKLKKINENCHFANASSIRFLPEDFYYKFDESFKNESFKNLFERLTLSLLLRVFVDVSEFDKNILTYKMFGYKTIQHQYEFLTIKTEFLHDYYQSYNDLFSNNSNFIDKIGLARNVISLHLIDQDFTNVKGTISSSVKSNYNIYLKENVKKYIDIKDKIADKLFSLSSRFDTIMEDLSKSFKSTFYTLTTILLSLILLKLVKGSAVVNIEIFTKEVYGFLVGLLLAMYIFKLYTISEINQRKDRLLEQYEQLKTQYISLLDTNDLNEIFKYDNFKSKNEEYIIKHKMIYSEYWDITLLIYFIIFSLITFYK